MTHQNAITYKTTDLIVFAITGKSTQTLSQAYNFISPEVIKPLPSHHKNISKLPPPQINAELELVNSKLSKETGFSVLTS